MESQSGWSLAHQSRRLRQSDRLKLGSESQPRRSLADRPQHHSNLGFGSLGIGRVECIFEPTMGPAKSVNHLFGPIKILLAAFE